MVVGVAIAWACTPQAFITAISPGSGPAGTNIAVTGARFIPAQDGQVELRWDSENGILLAQATASARREDESGAVTDPGGDFTAAISAPDVPAGTYAVVVVSRANDGSIAGIGRRAFTVTEPDVAAAESEIAAGDGQASGPRSQGVRGPQGGGSNAATQPKPSEFEPGAGGGNAAAEENTTSPSPAGAATPTALLPAGVASQPSLDSAGAAAPSSALTAAGTGAGGPASDETDTTPQPSPATAIGDLWSGFSGDAPAVGSGLLGGGAAAPADSSQTGVTVGIALLAVGLLGLMATFGLLLVRRRRAQA